MAFEVHPPAQRRAAALGTIVAVAGSAGEGTSAHRDELLALLRPLLARRDLVLVDRRGTGRRAPPAVLGGRPARLRRAARRERARSSAPARRPRTCWRCSTTSASPRADLYAAGYGTVVGQAFAARHPDRLRSLVLDGPVLATGSTPGGERARPP